MMKTAVLLSAFVALGFAACAQGVPASKVPSVVQNTVKTKFSNATEIEWVTKNGGYEAEFDINKVEHTALVDSNGKFLMYRVDLDVKDLPSQVSAAIAKDYAGYKIDEAEKLEKDGVTYYQVELDGKGKKDVNLVFTEAGAVATGVVYMD